MSKASEWAKTRKKGESMAWKYGRVLRLSVMLPTKRKWPRVGLRIETAYRLNQRICVRGAREAAKWILDTFEEKP
jgi:hypothetical protein